MFFLLFYVLLNVWIAGEAWLVMIGLVLLSDRETQ
jgi:hypothetical protein